MIKVEFGKQTWEVIVNTLESLEKESCGDFSYITNKINKEIKNETN